MNRGVYFARKTRINCSLKNYIKIEESIEENEYKIETGLNLAAMNKESKELQHVVTGIKNHSAGIKEFGLTTKNENKN